MKPTEFDSVLVARAQAGDQQARERLLLQLEPILRAFFIKRIGVKPEVDDLIQNTLLRVHGGLDDLKNIERLKAFSMKAALFELQDLYRGRYSAKENLYDPEFPPEQVERPAKTGLQVDLERALDQLTPKARRILELRQYGYRYEEIAEMIGSTEAAIKMQVKRAFEKLRKILVQVLIVGISLAAVLSRYMQHTFE